MTHEKPPQTASSLIRPEGNVATYFVNKYFRNGDTNEGFPPQSEGDIRQIIFDDAGKRIGYSDTPIHSSQENEGSTEIEHRAAQISRIGNRREAAKLFAKLVLICGGAALAGDQIVWVKEKITPNQDESVSEYELSTWAYEVQDGENLTNIVLDFYPEMSDDPEWIDSFIDNNIVNTTKDNRHRDRNTIYPGDILKITSPSPDELTPPSEGE